MSSITKRGDEWRAQIYVMGVRESRTCPTKAKAVAWAALRETEIREGAASGVQRDRTVDEAFRRYEKEVSVHKLGFRWEAIRLAAIGRMKIDGVELKEMRLYQVTPDTLGKLRDQRLTVDKVKGATVNRDFNLLSHVFSTARKEWKWIATSPTTDVRRPKNSAARDRIPTQDEIDRLCLALGFDDEPVTTKMQAAAVAYLFAFETAMRAGEICALLPHWISGAVAHLPATVNKNGIKRDVPLSKEARRLLTLLPDSEGGPVFGISAPSLDALFRKARGAALVEGTTFHDSRHAAITRLARKLNVLELARMVGHRDLRMLQVYYNESAANIAPRLD